MDKPGDYRAMFVSMVAQKASDLLVKPGTQPMLRVSGKIKSAGGPVVSAQTVDQMLNDIAEERVRKIFDEQGDVDTSYEILGVGRFRVSIFKQRGQTSFAFRHVANKIPTLEELNLPVETLKKLIETPRGLVLVTGTANSGKSTTIASMINQLNCTRHKHIITIEDPIEYLFIDDKSVIDQREMGIDTQSFASALKHALRQSPDIIMIGEMRDVETMQAAINAAETGHLVVSTLHTVNAFQTVERIVNFFPPYQHGFLREQIALLLEGVVSLRLLPVKDGPGLVPAVELMVASPTVKELLHEGKTRELYKAIRDGSYYGMQTFNQSLKNLYTNNRIGLDDALAAADDPDGLKLELRGILKGTKTMDFDFKK